MTFILPGAAALRLSRSGGGSTPVHNDWWTDEFDEISKLPQLAQCCVRPQDLCCKPFAQNGFNKILRYVGPARQATDSAADLIFNALKGWRLVLMGDSLTRQWFENFKFGLFYKR
eukprot:gnl/MRDRNA2_/MRDRNA2_54907_c0_seq2.p1 gnl/MRDRNA2_/MRDRNA2_54907_c0~~gnl/MRDRNA2_/MRDRNA2_54907_c0_seq2.p1  ORF type:complete len:115 (+),score=14.95 gnl/MRDRNA2_/MRDRNA2_54907_c0_seq2:71-415(+)